MNYEWRSWSDLATFVKIEDCSMIPYKGVAVYYYRGG